MPFTIVDVCALAEPVRGRLDQILMTPLVGALPPAGGVAAPSWAAGGGVPPAVSAGFLPQPLVTLARSASVVNVVNETASPAIFPNLLISRCNLGRVEREGQMV
jgi:hypothetical protein